MPTSTHNHLQHWSCLPDINIGMLGWANMLGPSVRDVPAAAGHVSPSVHAALVHPNLHVISSNVSKNTCSEYCMSTNTFKIHWIAFILKHTELKIRHNPECQRSIKNAWDSSNRYFRRARLVECVVVSVSASLVSCCQDTSALFLHIFG